MDLYQQPGIAETVNFDHIKRHYYMTHTEINPTRIVPIGPVLDLGKPHNRERVGLENLRSGAVTVMPCSPKGFDLFQTAPFCFRNKTIGEDPRRH